PATHTCHTLSLHDALPILQAEIRVLRRHDGPRHLGRDLLEGDPVPADPALAPAFGDHVGGEDRVHDGEGEDEEKEQPDKAQEPADRKSTRLNSSHVKISYA